MSLPPAGFRPLVLGPRSVERPADDGHTLVAGLDGATPARVDGGGLVTPHGASWSVDWWVGADDRWHLPAREPSVRQRRVGFGPVVETSLRVPSGDVVHTAYPVIVGGRTVTVIEIQNDSPVPVALALTVRPYAATGTRADSVTFALSDDGTEILADGQVGVVLPRRPNEAGASTTDDLFTAVSAGASLQWEGPISGGAAEGTAPNAAALYPLPHKTSLRFAIPGPVGGGGIDVDRLSDAAASARGWTAIVERAARFEFADPGVTAQAGASRARLLLEAERLAGRVLSAEPGSGLALEALAVGGHQVECGWALEALGRSFPARLTGDPLSSAQVVAGATAAASMVGEPKVVEALLEPMTQLTHLIERAERGQEEPPATALARGSLADLAELVGQHDAAADLRRARPGSGSMSIFGGIARRRRDRRDRRDQSTIDLSAVGGPGGPSGPPDLDQLMALGAEASPAGRWNPADSATEAARYWLMAREFMVRAANGSTPANPIIELLPVFPAAWRGGPVELHRAPVSGVRVSFAIRWHGYRPALLWDVEYPTADDRPSGAVPRTVTLRCPGLDPEWQSTERTGETLLTGSADELPETPAPGDSFN